MSEKNILSLAKEAKKAAGILAASNANSRARALFAIAQTLREHQTQIIQENAKDLSAGKKLVEEGKWAAAMLNRLQLTQENIHNMAQAVEEIIAQPEVVGEVLENYQRPNGLWVKRVRVPLGVVLMIFESRPNVVVDAAALAIKSGNAIILKGGKEAFHSNKILGELISQAIGPFIPANSVQLVESTDRHAVEELLTLNHYINLVVPRGGEGLIRMVYQKSTIPVVAHYKGLCHTYVHLDANMPHSVEICLNAKVQRPSVCNAMECLLVHQEIARPFLAALLPRFLEAEVEIRGCPKTLSLFPQYSLKKASAEDWDTEYLDKILSLKLVDSVEEAIAHIRAHGTQHTEAICAQDSYTIDEFIRQIDASCVCVNASTRFNDGGELGLGAELGISTSKAHAYGPMGARELTIPRFIVFGEGQIRN
ncbi:MAG: glutamate-5-semialdehyde dehydrogenase [Pseudomonadota bacterium]